jgi:hypothetical protein
MLFQYLTTCITGTSSSFLRSNPRYPLLLTSEQAISKSLAPYEKRSLDEVLDRLDRTSKTLSNAVWAPLVPQRSSLCSYRGSGSAQSWLETDRSGLVPSLGMPHRNEQPPNVHPTLAKGKFAIVSLLGLVALFHEFVRDLVGGYRVEIEVGYCESEIEEFTCAGAQSVFPVGFLFIFFIWLIFFFTQTKRTSALDSTSRILVFDALKRWRKNKSTIVITYEFC